MEAYERLSKAKIAASAAKAASDALEKTNKEFLTSETGIYNLIINALFIL